MSEWINFDKNDKSTWPEVEKAVLVYEQYSPLPFIGYWTDDLKWAVDMQFINVGGAHFEIYDMVEQTYVTHWQPLPEPPTN